MAKRKELIRFSLELVIIVAVTATVCTKIVVPVKIQGDSMYPTLHDKDTLIVNKLYLNRSDIKRFDIVVLKSNKLNQDIIKRVIGLPGDNIVFKDDIFKRIKNISPDIVLVALGVPKQELLIAKHYDNFSKGIFVGVGGTFDVISGTKKRAPQIIQKLNIEWLYRIIGNKERIKRFYDSNVKFIFKLRKLVKEEKYR